MSKMYTRATIRCIRFLPTLGFELETTNCLFKKTKQKNKNKNKNKTKKQNKTNKQKKNAYAIIFVLKGLRCTGPMVSANIDSEVSTSIIMF